MTYNKEYYEKNKEKLKKTCREWNKKHYKGLPKNNKKRIAALKAWETRRKFKKDNELILITLHGNPVKGMSCITSKISSYANCAEGRRKK